MYLEQCCKICVGGGINCFIQQNEVKFSNIVHALVVMSSKNQDFVLALTSPSNIRNWGSQLDILINFFSKLMIEKLD